MPQELESAVHLFDTLKLSVYKDHKSQNYFSACDYDYSGGPYSGGYTNAGPFSNVAAPSIDPQQAVELIVG